MHRFKPIDFLSFLFIFLFCLSKDSLLFAYSNHSRIVTIGISGGSDAGKQKIAKEIAKLFLGKAIIISQNSYYKEFTSIPIEEKFNINFDSPETLDYKLFTQHLLELKNSNPVAIPNYDIATNSKNSQEIIMEPAQVIIVTGTLILAIKEIRDLLDIKIFINTPSETRLFNRIYKYSSKYCRSFEDIKKQYLSLVLPMYKQHVKPSKIHADFTINSFNRQKIITNIIGSALNMHYLQNNHLLSIK